MTVETIVLEPEELEAFFDQVNTRTPTGARNYALLRLMAHAGIRCGEALQVRAGDIRREEWNGKRVWVLHLRKETTKGKRPRQVIPLPAMVRQAIEHWQEKRSALGIGRGPLFCTISRGKRIHGKPGPEGFTEGKVETEMRPGKPLNPRYVRALVTRLAKKAGIAKRVHPHTLRHTALTALYDSTQNLRMVQEVAGHASVQTTQRYTHVHPLAVAEAMGAIADDE